LSKPQRISQADLDRFYESIVQEVQDRGGICAITSGMACVKYGVAQSTKDCDVLCGLQDSQTLLGVLKETLFGDVSCSYRGNLTPPLDDRWLRGGWTAHFQWKAEGTQPQLDIFGVAPRASTVWQREILGYYVHRQTVAEMKRTDRAKDWPFATALGVQMLVDGDARGWLHIFDANILLEMTEKRECPDPIMSRRPVLSLAFEKDSRLKPAIATEQYFWQELDRIRIQTYEQAVRPYRAAVMRHHVRDEPDLSVQHSVRIECAEEFLVKNPLQQVGIERMIEIAVDEARALGGHLVDYLPDVRENFEGLVI